MFLAAVAVTPRTALWAFGVHAGLVVAATRVAGLGPRAVVRRLAIEAPFVAFALLLPVIGGEPRTAVGPWNLSVPGLWGAWSILARGTLGVAAASVLAATTRPADLVVGLQRLRVPAPMVAVLSFFVRYLDVVADDLRRTTVARAARGGGDRWFWQARGVAASVGALFVRTYERGERVHLAMRSRGLDGPLPDVIVELGPTGGDGRTGGGARTSGAADLSTWLLAGLPLAAVATAIAALALR